MATRTAVYEQLKTSPKFAEEVMQGAVANHVTYAEQLQNEADKGAKDASWNHPIVAKDFLRRDGLLLRSEGRKGSSSIEKFDKPYQRAILLDEVEDTWQNSFGNAQTRRRFQFDSMEDQHQANQIAVAEGKLPDVTPELRFELEQSGTITGFTPGSIYRPYQEGDQIETPAFVPDVPYTDLGRVQVITVPDWRVATFNVKKKELLMSHVPEGTPSPTIQLNLGSKTATAHRHALGIEIGNTQMLSGVPSVVEGLLRMTEEIGTQQADAYANRLAKIVADANTPGSAVTLGIESILNAQTELENSQPNRVIGGKAAIIRLITTQATFANAQVQNNAQAVVIAGGTRLGNRSAGTDVAYFFRSADSGFTGGKENMIVFYDVNGVLNILDYPGGEMDATDFNASTAMHSRFFARWQGQYVKDGAEYSPVNVNMS